MVDEVIPVQALKIEVKCFSVSYIHTLCQRLSVAILPGPLKKCKVKIYVCYSPSNLLSQAKVCNIWKYFGPKKVFSSHLMCCEILQTPHSSLHFVAQPELELRCWDVCQMKTELATWGRRVPCRMLSPPGRWVLPAAREAPSHTSWSFGNYFDAIIRLLKQCWDAKQSRAWDGCNAPLFSKYRAILLQT